MMDLSYDLYGSSGLYCAGSYAGPGDPPDPEVNEPEDLPESDPFTPPEGLPPDVQPDIPPVDRPEM